MTRPVVVGIDGSSQSIAAARFAAHEAIRCGLPLRLIHAWHSLPVVPGVGMLESDVPDVLAQARSEIQARHPDLAVETVQIPYGEPDGLVAASKDAELLVLGSRGLGGFAGLLLGSTGLDTAARSHCPVVLVRAQHSSAEECRPLDGDPVGELIPAPVVLGLDATEPSTCLLDFALRTAERRGAELRIIHAWHVPPLWSPESNHPGDRQHTEALRQQTLLLQDTLSGWEAKYPSVAVHPRAVFGGAAAVLVREAAPAALVIVGRHIRHPALGRHLGPVAHAVLHHAVCPVAVVPHE